MREFLESDWVIPVLITVTIAYACFCFYLIYKHERNRSSGK